ncbi:hypothetical protein BGZ88_002234 [Linnemannia elongata]|nr:hypothetical protein BGZ88_002234 [Linnemannia elongata]
MTQGDDSQEQVQAMRSVDINLAPSAVPPATPDEIFHVDTQLDPETQKEVVLWDDILQAFRNVVQVRNKMRVVPFLKGKDLRILEPRRIAAVPNIVLDVVVDSPLMDKGFTSLQVQQPALQAVLPQDGSTIKVEVAPQDIISTSSATSTPIITTATSTLNATSVFSVPSSATSAVRRSPVYGLVETAMENYTHIDRPLVFPSARGPQAVLDDRTPTVKDLPTTRYPDNDSRSQLRRPQIATTDVPVEMDVAQTSISASLGDKNAQIALGDMYRDGKGVPQDYQGAMDWYFKAIEQGDAVGQQRVGVLYEEGLGVSQSYSTAMEWYLKSAEQGFAAAQYQIGELYNYGRGVTRDYGRATEWYLKAAQQGDAKSQFNIGKFYHFAFGGHQDCELAMEWYLKAADQGHPAAQHSIGVLYDYGQGVPTDYAQAMEWYLKAAQQGHEASQCDVAYFYRYGRGVVQDYAKAVEWYQKAANQGNTYAQTMLEQSTKEMDPSLR